MEGILELETGPPRQPLVDAAELLEDHRFPAVHVHRPWKSHFWPWGSEEYRGLDGWSWRCGLGTLLKAPRLSFFAQTTQNIVRVLQGKHWCREAYRVTELPQIEYSECPRYAKWWGLEIASIFGSNAEEVQDFKRRVATYAEFTNTSQYSVLKRTATSCCQSHLRLSKDDMSIHPHVTK